MTENDLNFDTEFSSYEEADEMLDSLISCIGECVEEQERRTSLINPYRIRCVEYTYKLLKYLTKGMGATVSYKLHQPYRSMGSVTVICEELILNKIEQFIKVIELASNFEVYPKTNGSIQMNFTFHGLTKTIE